MERFEELKSYIEVLSDDIKSILLPVIEEIVYEEELLKKFRANPKTKSNMAMNKAYRQTKQLYQSDVKMLLWQLKQHETTEADKLTAMLAEFE